MLSGIPYITIHLDTMFSNQIPVIQPHIHPLSIKNIPFFRQKDNWLSVCGATPCYSCKPFPGNSAPALSSLSPLP